MLDNLYGDYEEFLNARLDDALVLMNDEIKAINDQSKAISSGIKEVKDAFGLDIKNYSDNVSGTIASTFENGKLTTTNTAISDATGKIKNDIDKMMNPDDTTSPLGELLKLSRDLVIKENGEVGLKVTDISQQIADAKAKAAAEEQAKREAEAEAARQEAIRQERQANGGLTVAENNQLKNARINVDDARNKIAVYQTEIEQLEQLRNKLNQQLDQAKTKKEKNKLTEQLNSTTLDIQKVEASIENRKQDINANLEIIEYLEKLMHANGFAVGSRNIPKKQMAWTQEDGTELIFRSSDGAMLTPLNQGDMVFTAQMTQRLWELASGMIPNSLGGQKLPNISSNNNNTINNNNEIVISLPNVNDYESFKQELQNDSRFEKFIQEVTIGQAMGNNSLSKRKY